MSIRALTEVWDMSEASGAHLLVLLALADRADDGGVSFPYESSLASKARCDEKTVRRALRDLQDRREIDVWEWYDKNTGRKRNCYRVIVGKLSVLRGVEPEDIRARSTLLRINVPTATRREVFTRDGWSCTYCGSKTDLVIDHVVAVADGGGNEPANLRTICKLCEARKGQDVHSGEGRDVHSERDEMSSPPRARPDRVDTSIDPSVGRELALSSAAAPKKPRPRNLVFDALATVCDTREQLLDVDSPIHDKDLTGEIVAAMASIRRKAQGLSDADLADEVAIRARAYRQVWKDITLTPSALAKHWNRVISELQKQRGSGVGGLSPSDIENFVATP